MAKFAIYKDERYPDYCLTAPDDYCAIEVSDELRERYEAAGKEYDEVQRLLKELYDKP